MILIFYLALAVVVLGITIREARKDYELKRMSREFVYVWKLFLYVTLFLAILFVLDWAVTGNTNIMASCVTYL